MSVATCGAGLAVDATAAFDPLSLGPYVLLDPDTFGLSDLATVGTATDSSGTGRDFTQSNGANKPIYHTSDLNGHATVEHDGGDKYVVGPDMSAITTGAYGIIVVKLDADPPASNIDGLWSFCTGSGGGFAQTHFPFQGDGVIYDGFGSTMRKATVDPASSLASWRIYAVRSKAGEWTSWLDGVQLYTTATNSPEFPASPQIGRGFVTNVLKGRWALCGIFPALTDPQAAQLLSWTQARFGL
jgi:hypothetical protein